VAWLQSTPKDKKKSLSEEKPQTRLERMEANRIEPRYPEVDAAHHLIDVLFSAGPVEAGGMGEIPLSSQEIQAWLDGAGIALNAWEFRSVRRLSLEYLKQSRASEEADCPAPYAGTSQEQQRDAVSKQIQEVFRRRMKRG
jgi:hypothetical protein